MTKLIACLFISGQALIHLTTPALRDVPGAYHGQAGPCSPAGSTLTFIDAPRCAVSGLPFPYGVGG